MVKSLVLCGLAALAHVCTAQVSPCALRDPPEYQVTAELTNSWGDGWGRSSGDALSVLVRAYYLSDE